MSLESNPMFICETITTKTIANWMVDGHYLEMAGSPDSHESRIFFVQEIS